MGHRLRILHISDLHIRGDWEKESWRRRRVLGDAWKRNLDELVQDGPVDMVAFTGDLAFSGRLVEYEGVGRFLDEVLSRLQCPRERLFVVPGNHDVDRSVAPESWKELRGLLRPSDAQEFSQWMASEKEWAPCGFRTTIRDEVLSRQAAYREWVRKGLGRPGLLPSEGLHPRLGYRETLRLPGQPFAVHIIGLDSAWLAGDDNDSGRLWLTEDQVMRLATEEGRELAGVRLALIHHPLDQLMDGAHARRLLAGNVDVLLRGHLHEAKAVLSEEPSSALRSLAAGCLYESDRYPNSCQLIQMTVDGQGRPEACDVLFRSWSSRGHWYSDDSQYPGTNGGRLRWWGPEANDARAAAPRGLFVGREEQLQDLAKDSVGTRRPVAVQGTAGVKRPYLSWLHLSDLHLGVHGSRLLRPENREAFEQDLRRLHAGLGPWDLVFITGDLTMSGSTREFDLLNSTLETLWEYFRSLGSDPALLVVPGNHDLWRGPSKGAGVGERCRALDARRALRGSETSTLEQAIRESFIPFNNWFNRWCLTHSSPQLQSFERGLLPGDFAATVKTEHLKVGIIGLNSNFLSAAKDRAEGKYEVDVEQVEWAFGKNVKEWGQRHDFVMLLTHHPPAKLRTQSLTKLGEALIPPEHLLLHLCGSGHAEGGAGMEFRFRPWSLAIQAPSLFSEARAEAAKGAWGYTAGVIDTPGVGGRLMLFPRAASIQKGVLMLGADAKAVPAGRDALEIPMADLLWKRRVGESAARVDAKSTLPALSSPAPSDAFPQVRVLKDFAPPSLPLGVNLGAMLDTGGEGGGWMAWSPTEDMLGIGLSGGHIACWKLGEDRSRWTLRAHKMDVADLAFSPDGEFIASRSKHSARIWRVDGRRVALPESLRHEGLVMAWSSRGVLAVDDAEAGGVQGWNTRTWSKAGTLTSRDNFFPLRIVYALAWSPDGAMLACGGEGRSNFMILEFPPNGGSEFAKPASHVHSLGGDILDIAWKPGSRLVAAASRDKTIYVLDADDQYDITVLEGHTDVVTSVTFSFDGQLLASKSLDGAIRLWRTDTWETVAQLHEPAMRQSYAGLAFSPRRNILASSDSAGGAVRLWDIDADKLLGARAAPTIVHEVSAKVVLVGEGRVGKSCLALRMAEDEYRDLDFTHGMQFWSMPLESSKTAGARRELVLWDLGGQSEYQLVHQLFLKDSAAALMVMEPGRGEGAMAEIEGWNQRLVSQVGGRDIRKILVGTKVDSPVSPVDRPALEALVQRLDCEKKFILTSAKTGQGILELKQALSEVIDWAAMEKSSRPELFQRIRDLIQRLRESKRVVLTFKALEDELRKDTGSAYDPEALRAVVGHLTRQGLVADTRMGDGQRVLILEVEQLERYAGALIVAARENAHGVPAINMAKVMSPDMKFPRILPEHRLPRDQELPVIDCVIELLIEHGICLRHEGLLIFPSLFQPLTEEPGTSFSRTISLHYDFSGPIDNMYASLIASLALSRRFGAMRLWKDRAEFGQAGKDSSGVRRVQSQGQSARGIAQLDVYFDEGTPESTRELFVNFIEEHLSDQGVTLLERLAITCSCGIVFAEDVVRRRLAEGKQDIGCPSCDSRTQITLGAQQSRERNPDLKKDVQALRTVIREMRSQVVAEVKVSITEQTKAKPVKEAPIRILHLSDLHVEEADDPDSLLEPLAADLFDNKEGLGVERLDYLVISGDITQRASQGEFEKARQFVSKLIEQFGLTAQSCIIVPGNHDLDWNTQVYNWQNRRLVTVGKLPAGSLREQGDGYLVRDDAKYPERFKNFSDHFYHPLIQRAYPLTPQDQCIPLLFTDSRIQFLAMNSSWQIDEYFRERSSISEQALSKGLIAAKELIKKAQEKGELAQGDRILRLAVWHHPVTGNEKMQADAFMDRLLQADYQVCLHGHVHEDRADLFNYLHPVRRMNVIGAGSFGAPTHERPESVPRLYNLLEVQPDLKRIRVHTRGRPRNGGRWGARAVWPGEKPGELRSCYDVTLP
nr:metallophosphoesterase [Myxococcus sp. AB036A]